MMSPFKSRSARAQTHYARHINKVAAGNEFATPLMLNALYAACEEWYFAARTKPENAQVTQALMVEMELLPI
jgi:hypothetical protein